MADYTTRFDIGADAIYMGEALSGTASSEAKWKIVKYTLVAGDPTAKEWAEGSPAFVHIWDNRVSLSYS